MSPSLLVTPDRIVLFNVQGTKNGAEQTLTVGDKPVPVRPVKPRLVAQLSEAQRALKDIFCHTISATDAARLWFDGVITPQTPHYEHEDHIRFRVSIDDCTFWLFVLSPRNIFYQCNIFSSQGGRHHKPS